MPKDHAYFDIDLEARPNDRFILEHIIRVAISTTNIFVFKKAGASVEDTTLGFGLSQMGILQHSQIFSGDSSLIPFPYADNNRFFARQAIFDADLIGTSLKSAKSWLNLMGHNQRHFYDYMNYIFGGTDDYSKYLRQFLVRY